MIIDFHVHMFPDKITQNTIKVLAERSGLTPFSDGSVACTMNAMKEAGVTHFVHLNIATNPHQMQKVNDFAIMTNQYPDITSFGSIHPDAENFEYELDRLQDVGIRGIKLHPDYQDFFVDEPRMQAVYEAILKRDFILLFHAGLDIGLPEPVHASPKAIHNTLGLFSGEKVVFAHLGCIEFWEEGLELLIGKDIYIDTSNGPTYAPPGVLKEILTAHPAGKILFASDFPWSTPKNDVSAIQNLDISDALKENIFCQNAKSLLHL